MQNFAGKIAVITGGGTGMGRALALQLVAEGCDVAMCDVSEQNLTDSIQACNAEAPQGVRVSGFVCNVADADQMNDFAEHVAQEFNSTHINLLFTNAGIVAVAAFSMKVESNGNVPSTCVGAACTTAAGPSCPC